jgi:hypothetical protein
VLTENDQKDLEEIQKMMKACAPKEKLGRVAELIEQGKRFLQAFQMLVDNARAQAQKNDTIKWFRKYPATDSLCPLCNIR